MRITIYTKKDFEMQNRNNYSRSSTSFPVQQKQSITVAQLEHALSDTVSVDVQLPVLTRSSSVMPEPVNFNGDRKITHDKKFSEVWGFPQDIMKTIPTAIKYNVVASDMNFNSGRQKFICSFYNKNHDLLERHLAMSLFSKKTNKQYYSVMIEVMRD